MLPFDLAISCISFTLIALGFFYQRLKRSVFNETLLAMLAGILMSVLLEYPVPIGGDGKMEEFMERASQLTLAMALLATAFRIPQQYLSTNKVTQAVLLFLVMPAMWLVSAAIFHFILNTSWLLSLLLGAIVTPTDPVLAGTIITGKKAEQILPARTRNSISFEAGANDGLAFPFVMLCILLIQKGSAGWQEWALKSVLWETGGAIVFGLLIGYLFGKVLDFCLNRNMTSKPAVLAFALSTALFTVTTLELIDVNGILAVFVLGLLLKKTLAKREDVEEEEIQEMMSRLFTIPVFIFFGLLIPWQQWIELRWKAVAVVVLILLFRRLPFLLLATPLLKGLTLKDTAFMGWFGPVGVAAVFYSFFSYKKLMLDDVWPLTSLIIFSSVIVHGMTAYPFLKWYGRKRGD